MKQSCQTHNIVDRAQQNAEIILKVWEHHRKTFTERRSAINPANEEHRTLGRNEEICLDTDLRMGKLIKSGMKYITLQPSGNCSFSRK